jgi:pyridoxal phosphate enzyme (YggS family)
MPTIADNLATVRARIRAAAERVRRNPAEVQLIAVSKTIPLEIMREAVAEGVTVFGESRIQEAKAKIPELPGSLQWHLIGHLQTNKAREAVALFHMIHSVDSIRLALELDKCAERAALTVPVLLECNVSGESTKFGFKPDEVLEALAELNGLRRLEIRGLMTMAPFFEDPQEARPTFRALRELRDRLQQRHGIPLPALSMGMTNDFETAIEEGATLVRIGTAIFRPSPAEESPP